jgi:1,4-dihydroxy-2-naphthoyl-CoA hydrolase
MTDDVYFFAVQFSATFGRPGGGKNRKIVDLSLGPQRNLLSMPLFNPQVTLERLNALSRNTMAEAIGIEFTRIGDDFLEARMPVDRRTHQPLGLLHGGASVALAETMGSVAATCCVDADKQFCVGLEINANHLRSARTGYVTGVTRPIHIGKKTQVWEIRITSEGDELVCISRITMAVLDKKN